MNYFQLMAYSNIVLCILVGILVFIEVIKLIISDKDTEQDILDTNKQIDRKLKDILNKLEK